MMGPGGTEPASVLGERFEIRSEIGSGSFGRVVHARDRRYGLDVAIKILSSVEPAALVRFKREFRALAHVSHPNLVSLYELHASPGAWFFTMELVRGTTLARWLSSAPRSVNEIRFVFAQIAAGIVALHDAGLLHRDLKPSNVLVAANGRVALADFGMIGSIDPVLREREDRAMGAVAYSPPEAWNGRPWSAASDWYSFGTMLFEALTGQRAFTGPMPAQIASRLMRDGPRPTTIVRAAPVDLDDLCAGLMRKEPEARLGAHDALSVLSQGASGTPRSWMRGAASFVGRAEELALLERALDESRTGGARVKLVTGPPGIGKSAVVLEIAARARARGAMVLEGRCHPHDGLHARALDAIVDALVSHLLRSKQALPEVLEGAGALVQMFPALEGLVNDDGTASEVPGKPQREAALGCLATVLRTIAETQQLVLVIDDLQWADDESGVALGALVRRMEKDRLFVVATARTEDAASPPVQALRSAVPWARALALSALPDDAALRLVEEVLGHGADARARAVIDAAHGNPYLLAELAASLRAPEKIVAADGDSRALVHEVVSARLSALPSSAQRLLDVIVLAAQPIDPVVVIEAAGVGDADYLRDLGALRTSRLATPRLVDGRQTVEPYHANVRDAVARRLDDESRRALHLALASALQRSGRASHDRIARHLFAGDDLAGAYRHAREAAREARASLAFGVCASMLRLALGTGRASAEEGTQIVAELADALANAGRGREAADAFLELATIDPAFALVNERRAAEQLLYSGNVEEGTAVLQRVLSRVGLREPRSRSQAVARVVWAQRFGAGRKLRAGTLSPTAARVDLFARVDAGHAAALGLAMIDPLTSAYMQAHHLEDALACGDPERIVRALSVHMVQTAGGGHVPDETRRLTELARSLVRDGTPVTKAYVACAVAGVAWMEGRLAEALAEAKRAGELLRSASCVGMQWHIGTQRVMLLELLEATGAWCAIGERFAAYLGDAEERGDRFLDATLRSRFGPTLALAMDEPARAREELDRARRTWGRAEFDLVALYSAIRTSWCDLYEGDAERAASTMNDAWRAMQKGLLVRVAFYRDMAMAARAVALSSWLRAIPGRSRSTEREVEEAIASLLGARTPVSLAYATMLAASRKPDALARGGYRIAAARFDAIGAGMLAAACRWRADATVHAPARLARPERVFAMLAP